MRTRTRILFVARDAFSDKIRFFGLLGLMIISLILIGASICLYQTGNNVRVSYEHALSSPVKDCGRIYFDAWDKTDHEVNDCLDEIKKIDGITMAGFSNCELSWGELNELRNIQKENQPVELETESEGLDVFLTEPDMFQICNVSLLQGKTPSEEHSRQGEELLYLGYNFYGKVDMGQEYVVHDQDGNIIVRYRVAGFLKKGGAWLSPDVAYELLTGDVTKEVSTDNGVYIVILNKDTSPLLYTNYRYVQVSENVDKEAMRKQLLHLLEKYDMDIQLGWFEGMIGAYEGKLAESQKYLRQLTIMMGSICFVILLCVQTMESIAKYNRYGIFYANGASLGDLCWIIGIESGIRMIVAVCLSVPAIYLAGKYYFVKDIPSMMVFQYFIVHSVLKWIVIIAALMTVCSCMIPFVMLRRSSPAEMIGGNQK